ncbi:MAG: flagellar protein FhlB [Alphaproteobacteria bacterium]|nr:EscU/YscU/HrcU family type III secretion system export apparatus switch protein [Alphaproteobacteria bacterium]TAD88852.1 MAG: flagellar protein FhlB [Alphaproteobacteria bacterium]
MTEDSEPERRQRRPIAVAVKHEWGEVPTVVASGKGALAEKILEIAFATGIKVREDADLAQLLQAVELDAPIPLEAFEAVAEILNYLYAANAAAGPGRRQP